MNIVLLNKASILQSGNWFKSKLFCEESCDDENKHRLIQSQRLKEEARLNYKLDQHVEELSLLMRCRNNPLCNSTKPCDSCENFSKSLKNDLNHRSKIQKRENETNYEIYKSNGLSESIETNPMQFERLRPGNPGQDVEIRLTRNRKRGTLYSLQFYLGQMSILNPCNFNANVIMRLLCRQ